jgi:hypothetical protein
MRRYAIVTAIAAVAATAAFLGTLFLGGGARSPLDCIEARSSGSFACTDAGNFESTCAMATCPAEYALTGGGGACAAGDRKLKSLFPRLDTGQFTINCEQQGTAPQARAICCRR